METNIELQEAKSEQELQEFFKRGKIIAQGLDKNPSQISNLDIYKECLSPECDC